MPPPLPAPNVAQVTHRWSLNGRPGSNRFTIHYSGVWDPGDALAIVSGSIVSDWDTDLLGHFGAAFQGVEWEIVDLADPLHAAVVNPHATIGGGPDPCLPNINTLDVYWPVSSRHRGGRSHSFLAGWQTSGLSGGDSKLWSATQTVAALTWAGHVRAHINSVTLPTLGTLELGVVHYHRNHLVLSPPEFEAFLAPIVDARVHSRSRRLAR